MYRLVFCLFVGVFLAGCESTRNDVAASFRERFAGPTYRTKVFNGEQAEIFAAARGAADELGFKLTRVNEPGGVIEGFSLVMLDDTSNGSRQRTIKVRIAYQADGSWLVGVVFTEIVEDDFDRGRGQGTETTLRESPLYASFFNRMNAALVR